MFTHDELIAAVKQIADIEQTQYKLAYSAGTWVLEKLGMNGLAYLTVEPLNRDVVYPISLQINFNYQEYYAEEFHERLTYLLDNSTLVTKQSYELYKAQTPFGEFFVKP